MIGEIMFSPLKSYATFYFIFCGDIPIFKFSSKFVIVQRKHKM